jgi:hypothetical protein
MQSNITNFFGKAPAPTAAPPSKKVAARREPTKTPGVRKKPAKKVAAPQEPTKKTADRKKPAMAFPAPMLSPEEARSAHLRKARTPGAKWYIRVAMSFDMMDVTRADVLLYEGLQLDYIGRMPRVPCDYQTQACWDTHVEAGPDPERF